ncbi:MAG: hypothetical protein KJ592_04940 [Nanoarchaeota archaeon]|nr:hypothetical protein [Nanoarchaeota archaeon]
MSFALDERISKNWRDVLSHPTERHRPTNESQGFSAEEIGYISALNIGKRVFLERVGDELHRQYLGIKTKVTQYGDGEGLLGYRLAIPFSIVPPRRSIGLVCIGDYDHDLEIHANNPRIIEIIRQLSPAFEDEVMDIETQSSGLEPLKVYVKSNDRWALAPIEKVETYFQRYNP